MKKEIFKDIFNDVLIKDLNALGYKVHHCSNKKTNKEFLGTTLNSAYYVMSYPYVVYYYIQNDMYITLQSNVPEDPIYDYYNEITTIELPKVDELYDPKKDVIALKDKAIEKISELGKVPFTCKKEWWKKYYYGKTRNRHTRYTRTNR